MDWSESHASAQKEFEELRKKLREELPRVVELRSDLDNARLAQRKTAESLARESGLRHQAETSARDAESRYVHLIKELQSELRRVQAEAAKGKSVQEADARSQFASIQAAWDREKALLLEEISRLKRKNDELWPRLLAAEKGAEQARDDEKQAESLLAQEMERRGKLELHERELEAAHQAKLRELEEQALKREQLLLQREGDLEGQAAQRQALLEQAWQKETAALLNELARWRQNAQDRMARALELEKRAAAAAEENDRLSAAFAREANRRAELEKALGAIEEASRARLAAIDAAWKSEREISSQEAARLEARAKETFERASLAERALAQAQERAAHQGSRADLAEQGLDEARKAWAAERAKLEERLAALSSLAQARLDDLAAASSAVDAAREQARKEQEERYRRLRLDEQRLAAEERKALEASAARAEELARSRLLKIEALEGSLEQVREQARREEDMLLQKTVRDLEASARQREKVIEEAWHSERASLQEEIARLSRMAQERVERLVAAEEQAVKAQEERAKLAARAAELEAQAQGAEQAQAAERQRLEQINALKKELERWKDDLVQKEFRWTQSMNNLERSAAAEKERLAAEAQRADKHAQERLAEVVALQTRLEEGQEKFTRAEEAVKAMVEQAKRLQAFKEKLEEQYQARVESLKAEEKHLARRQEEHDESERDRQQAWERRASAASDPEKAALADARAAEAERSLLRLKEELEQALAARKALELKTADLEAQLSARAEEIAKREAVLAEKAKALDEAAAQIAPPEIKLDLPPGPA